MSIKKKVRARRRKARRGRKETDMMNLVMETPNMTIVDRAIAKLGGSPVELARRLSEYAGEQITRQRVHGWRLRGIFPRPLLVHVEKLTGIGLNELLTAKPRERDRGSPVQQAIEKVGGTAARFAAALSKSSGRDITRQMVNNWQAAEQFPRDVVLEVHLLTKIPVDDLMLMRLERKH